MMGCRGCARSGGFLGPSLRWMRVRCWTPLSLSKGVFVRDRRKAEIRLVRLWSWFEWISFWCKLMDHLVFFDLASYGFSASLAAAALIFRGNTLSLFFLVLRVLFREKFLPVCLVTTYPKGKGMSSRHAIG
jgi:hypothetical protein